MGKNLNEYTKEEFLEMGNFYDKDWFNDIIVVPTDELHDSGYRCMKFILVHIGKIVGAVSGWSDVIHFNGIGGMGKYPNSIFDPIQPCNYSMDCLDKSGCVRIMTQRKLEIDDFIGSSFNFHVGESIYKGETE